MSEHPIATETREHNGHTIKISWFADDNNEAPWKEHDGHGIVSEWTTRDKAPGERVLWEDRRSKLYYDVAESIALAKRDGWDAKPYNTDKRQTKGQQAAKAVEADYDFLRRWCAGEWYWCGYVVEVDGEHVDSLWGIESDAINDKDSGYTYDELFSAAIAQIDEEATEAHNAACRDIVTV